MILLVKVIPNAPKNALVEYKSGTLKVKINAPPEKGKANEALITYLAELLSLPKSKFRIVSGHTSRLKKVEISQECDLSVLTQSQKT